MSNLTRLNLLAAFLSLGAAFALLIDTGLPDRADYTEFRKDNGRTFAPEVGSPAPTFILRTASAEPLTLEGIRGTVTVINFWATWCQPCRREMRELQKLYERHPGELRILAVNLGESVESARKWVNQLGLTYDVLLDQRGTVAQSYQVRGLPTTYLLDSAHRIRRVYFGPLRYEQLKQDLARLDRKA